MYIKRDKGWFDLFLSFIFLFSLFFLFFSFFSFFSAPWPGVAAGPCPARFGQVAKTNEFKGFRPCVGPRHLQIRGRGALYFSFSRFAVFPLFLLFFLFLLGPCRLCPGSAAGLYFSFPDGVNSLLYLFYFPIYFLFSGPFPGSDPAASHRQANSKQIASK